MVTLEPEKLRQLKDVASVPEEEELLSTWRGQKVLEEGRTQENQAGPSCVRSCCSLAWQQQMQKAQGRRGSV